MTRRTGNEGLHERVVEDKREKQLERLTWAEAADALDAATLAVASVPDPSLHELAMVRRLGAVAARARRQSRVGEGFPEEGSPLETVRRLESEEL